MDNFNRIVSFVLGLIVVIVFLLIITGRFGFRGGNLRLGGSNTPTPTPAIKQVTPTTKVVIPTQKYQTPSSIPASGVPTLFVPILSSLLGVGMFLRKTGKK